MGDQVTGFEQTHPIFRLSEQIVDEIAEMLPGEATYLGISGYDDQWPDLSPEGTAAVSDALMGMVERVEALPATTDRWEQLAVDVALDELRRRIDFYESGETLLDLNSIASPVQELKEAFDHMSRDGVEAWRNIAARLEGLSEVLVSYHASLEEGRRTGRVVPQRQALEAARQCDVTASESSGLLLLLDDYDESDIDDAGLRLRLATAIDEGRAAYGELGDYLRTVYAPDAAITDASGEERYRALSRSQLGTDLDFQETYEWAWTEVASLRERMETVASEIAPGGTFADALEVLKTDPDRLAETPDDLVAFLASRIDEALERLAGSHFDVPAEIRQCDVKLAPEGGSLGAYYVGPSEDFSRPGSVWWSIERDKPQPLYDNVSTAYHEGFPGHHLQVGVQVGLRERLSRIHRMIVWLPGTGEGWALYAERLMDELGYLDKPDYVFGFLAGQMLRACRVVIDIGSHLELRIPEDQPFHPGEAWNYETAVEMLEEYATVDAASARSEVTRYYGWPAQAIAYKVGERAILAVRDEVEAAEGDAFDLRSFHQRLLEVGPVGIDLMRRFVTTGSD